MRSWCINEETLEEWIEEDKLFLTDKALTDENKASIKQDIKNLQQFLQGKFDIEDKPEESEENLNKLKNKALVKMKKIYNVLGERVINFLVMVNTFWPFPENLSLDETEISLEDQIALTCQNYAYNSPFLLPVARSMISKKPISQIQRAKLIFSSSYTYMFYPKRVPLLIVDSTEAPWVFNHELQHCIEYFLGCDSTYYDELGPITMEMLYLDLLYQRQGFLQSGDYAKRIDDIDKYITHLTSYFCIMRKLASKDFKVSLKCFEGLIREYFILDKSEVKDFVKLHILGSTFDDYLRYTLGFLKAMELREEIKEKQIDAFKVIKPFIRQRRKNFDIPNKPLANYERYYDERIKQTK